MTKEREKEFLLLASIVLKCRLKAMGGKVFGDSYGNGNLALDILGIMDYGNEMRLMMKEERK